MCDKTEQQTQTKYTINSALAHLRKYFLLPCHRFEWCRFQPREIIVLPVFVVAATP
jgi:hypothetical protein